MQKLIENDLFGDGLIAIDKQHLIDRYNSCLKDIGLKSTKLDFFHIDKWGWSPEIANESNNQNYLSFGYANPFGIIISPDQKNASIYHPFHSFDWELMDKIYNSYSQQITDITTQFGLWFEVDQEMSTYRKPQDLLSLQHITVKFHTPGNLIAIAKEQKKLVQQFYDDRKAWSDQNLHTEILKSAIKYGDLRNRNVEISPLSYKDISSFYTGAFNGLFIIRTPLLTKALLIFEDSSSTVSGNDNFNHIEYNIHHDELMAYLKLHKLILNDLEYFHHDVFSLINLRDTMLMNLIVENYPDETIDLKVDRIRSKFINMLSQDKKLTDDFYALEDIISANSRQARLNIGDYPKGIQQALSYPNPKLSPENKKIIWGLIVKTSPVKDVLLHYLFDRNQFFSDFNTWANAKQDWAIQVIKEQKQQMYHYKINRE